MKSNSLPDLILSKGLDIDEVRKKAGISKRRWEILINDHYLFEVIEMGKISDMLGMNIYEFTKFLFPNEPI